MTTEHDPRTRTVVSWLREDGHENAERVLLSAMNEIDHTRQRRSMWPAWRFSDMNAFAKLIAATGAVVVVAVVGFTLIPRGGSGTGPPPSPTPSMSPSPSPSPAPSPAPSPSPSPSPAPSIASRVLAPFAGLDALGMCSDVGPGPSTCVEDPRDDSITFTAPPTWQQYGAVGMWIDGNAPPGGASVFFYRGNSLFGDPCLKADNEAPTIAVGPTIDDLVSALVDHPSLDVTSPVDVTLAGYRGKYVDLTVPDDISTCLRYQPIADHIFAQGPSHRWHMWVLDVDGVRVVVETNDYPGTSAQRLAEEQAIIDSLEITP